MIEEVETGYPRTDPKSDLSTRLYRTEETLKLIFENTNDAICLLDEHMVVRVANACMLRKFNLNIDDIPHKKCWEHVHHTTEPIHGCPVEQMLKTQKRASAELVENGIEVEVTVDPIFDDTHKLVGVVHTMRDISERKRLERELIDAKEKAEESSRLKTAFLNNISHEVRTPMNAIIGFSNLLYDENVTPESRKQFIDIITTCSRQLLSIIDDVLQISRLESGTQPVNLIEFDVNCFLQEIAFSLKPLAVERNLHLIADPLPKKAQSIQIIADREKVRQIINGLITNAFKFTKEGGVHFGCKLDNNFIVFYVKDSGIGIPETELDKIFDRFYQIETAEVYQSLRGTGLGLSIAKGLTQLMGGHIWAESVINEGSQFNFTIPLQQSKLKEVKVKSYQTVPDISQAVVLVADDEALNYEFIKEAISKKVKKVLWARNGAEAYEMVLQEKIDLILMDLKMPIMDGIEAARKIKEACPEIRIIAQSAYTQLEDKKRAIANGCSAYICKPLTRDILMDSIRKSSTEPDS